MLGDMASIVKKSNKYSTYYVVAESKRVNGKPRIVKQWYLGTIESIIQMAEEGQTGRNHGKSTAKKRALFPCCTGSPKNSA